jgi:Flp pilus assembly protein TadB
MNITTLSTIELALVIALAVIVVTVIAAWIFSRKRRTKKLRAQFGGAEYARAVEEGGSRRHAEAGLKERTERVGEFKNPRTRSR